MIRILLNNDSLLKKAINKIFNINSCNLMYPKDEWKKVHGMTGISFFKMHLFDLF